MSTTTITSTATQPSRPNFATQLLPKQPVNYLSHTNGRLRLAIDGDWYDLTHFQHSHPGGATILTYLNGKDATDAFYSLHSEEAIERLQRLKKTISTPVKAGELPELDKSDVAFRQLRQRLIKESWFKRSLAWELFYGSQVYILAILGTLFAYWGWTWMAILALGVAQQQGGWLGHDYGHGRGKYQYFFGRIMAGSINAFSPTWWSDKHNTHHVYPNHVGIDVDIENDPVFHLFFPNPGNDVWFRRFQHIYFPFAASFLFVSWRIQSIQYTFKTHNAQEFVLQLLNYLWLTWLGAGIAFGSVMLAGFLVAVVVTVTHQSEDMLPPISCDPKSRYSYVEAQFKSTRDARTDNVLMNYLWGGMQFQLEHHLFPTIPKYYYNKLVHVVEQWANETGIEYRYDTVWDICVRNYNTLKTYAQPIPSENQA